MSLGRAEIAAERRCTAYLCICDLACEAEVICVEKEV